MEKLNFSNKHVYSGSGFMRSNITSEFKTKIDSIMNYLDGNKNIQSLINLIDYKDFIDTGFIYYKKYTRQRSQSRNMSLIYKYGSRRMKLRLPSLYDDDYIWVSVIMPDVLVARESINSPIYLGFANIKKLWPFHNTYSIRGYLSEFIDSNVIDKMNHSLRNYIYQQYLDQFCIGYSVRGIKLESTPELFTHTLLTSVSNYDLSVAYSLTNFICNNEYKRFNYDIHNKFIDLSKVSNLFHGYLNSNDLLKCETRDDITQLLKPYIDTDIDDQLLDRSYDYNLDSTFEWMMKSRNESFNLIIVGIMSAFGNVELIEEVIKN